jgi:uncharacterized integral membrane protein
MPNLHQRKLFTTKDFTLKESGLHVRSKTISTLYEVEIPFEEINLKKVIIRKKSEIFLLVISVIFAFVFVANLLIKLFGDPDINWPTILILFGITCFCSLVTFFVRVHSYFIPTTNNGLLEIYFGKPNLAETEVFLSDLKHSINQFLKDKYGKIDMDLPRDVQLSNLMWLRDREILSDDEFETLKLKLIGKVTMNNTIGYKN